MALRPQLEAAFEVPKQFQTLKLKNLLIARELALTGTQPVGKGFIGDANCTFFSIAPDCIQLHATATDSFAQV